MLSQLSQLANRWRQKAECDWMVLMVRTVHSAFYFPHSAIPHFTGTLKFLKCLRREKRAKLRSYSHEEIKVDIVSVGQYTYLYV